VIFTEGNHLMVLPSDDIVGAFPAWAKSQPEYTDLNLENIVVSTLPQPVLVEAIRAGGIAFGNLKLEVSRRSGLYPDIFMGYPEPLRQLRRGGVVEPQARFFCRNRGVTLLVRKGNPLGIHGLNDVLRAGTRFALPDAGDVRAKCRAAAEALLEKPATDTLFAAEVRSFPGRLGIMHRDLPEMVARSYADVAFTWYHLVSYWTRIFPDHFEAVAVPDAELFLRRSPLLAALIRCVRVRSKLLTNSYSAERGTLIPTTILRAWAKMSLERPRILIELSSIGMCAVFANSLRNRELAPARLGPVGASAPRVAGRHGRALRVE
jgi:hypothetical protein